MMPFLAAGTLSPQHVTVLLLSLAVLLGAARLLGEAARWLGQPAVIGEILAGIVLGKTVLGRWPALGAYDFLFPAGAENQTALQALIILAVTLLLLVAGLEVDLSTVWRQGRAALLVSLTGLVIPFALGFLAAWLGRGYLGMAAGAAPLPFALFFGIALSITALPVIARIMIDLNMFRSDMGMLIMSAAMVNDLIGWIGFAFVLAMIAPAGGAEGGGSGVAHTILLTLVFLGLMMTLGRGVIHRLIPVLQAKWTWPGGVISFVLTVTLACAAFTEWIGIHSIFGAFIAGVAIGDSSHLRERTRDTIHQFITYIFAPIFFASIGLRVNFVEAFDLRLVLVVVALALATKIGGCYLGATWAGMGRRESLAVGFGMAARGAMEIILGQIAYQQRLITEPMLVAVIVMALTTSLIAGPAMQRLLRQRQPRRFWELLGDRHYLPVLRARTPREAIDELAGRAAELAGIDAAALAGEVWSREQLMPTGIGRGLAVPHARSSRVKQPTVVLGRSPEGVDFNAPDGTPSHFICLLLTPPDQQTAQIELLGAVARAFENPEARARLRDAGTASEVIAALQLSEAEEPATAAGSDGPGVPKTVGREG